MTADRVLLEERPATGVLVLRLSRPAVLNALNLDLRRSLAEAFAQANRDDDVRAVILAGSERAFCAGADLQEYLGVDPLTVTGRQMGSLWDAIAQRRKPVIAAVRGHALGGGCELAMHADIIIAGESARFGQPEILIGLMPGGGATQRLTRVLGKFRATKFLLTGEAINAAEALQMGLASEVVADSDVETRAITLATQFARGPQLAIQAIKESVMAGLSMPLQQGLDFERKAFQLLFASPDKDEGIRARLDKRPARFGERA